jgi:mannosyl-oligosaccharide alpha-1,2-mannosidase
MLCSFLKVDFRYLSEMTGDPKYANAVNRVFELMAHKKPPHGLYPIYVNTRDGSFTNSNVTFGALGDSFYEYLLKVSEL